MPMLILQESRDMAEDKNKVLLSVKLFYHRFLYFGYQIITKEDKNTITIKNKKDKKSSCTVRKKHQK